MSPICITVDVDTHDGMRVGVPRLLDAFKRHAVRATFFLSLGPDRSGCAIIPVLRSPAFLRKMISTSAPSLYGWRTILSGTVLPSRPIATAFPEVVRRIIDEGHEPAVHAWDHRAWQDDLPHFKAHRIRAHYQRAVDAFRRLVGSDPIGCRAPAWMTTPASLAIQDRFPFRYASDLRGTTACRLIAQGRQLRIPQFPGAGACLEEIVQRGTSGDQALAEAIATEVIQHRDVLRIAILHAEVEGGPFSGVCDHLLLRLRDAGRLSTMAEATAAIDVAALPQRHWRWQRLPGRAFPTSTATERSP